MESQAKKIYEKMVDYKRFASILLSVGVFFYLGVIIPSAAKSTMDSNIMILASMSFLVVSFLFFTRSKQIKLKLQALEEENE
ncbi:MAG: YrhC family protein [Bacillota bacterium]|nr:YrhC family protein [Bacillota bacterium]